MIGALGMTMSVESGDIRLWESGSNGPASNRYHRYRYGDVSLSIDVAAGPLSINTRMSHMKETDTVLGARFSDALGGGGAASWFADANATLDVDDRTRIGSTWRHGWTQISSGPVRTGSTLVSRALSVGLRRDTVIRSGDSISLRWSEPLRVTSGGLVLTGLGSEIVQFGLTPNGHERDFEAVYAMALGSGQFTGNAYWRHQPGNFAAAPSDLGAAIRYAYSF